MRAFLIGWLMLVTAACAEDPVAKEPVWGKQPCANCAMLLSEKAHGAQVLTADGDRLYFDDLGCLIAWTDTHPQVAHTPWVRTHDTQAWLALTGAGFAPAEHTPMDFGFVATAKPGGTPWAQVTAAVHAKLRAPAAAH